jgi:hypothetical protein
MRKSMVWSCLLWLTCLPLAAQTGVTGKQADSLLLAEITRIARLYHFDSSTLASYDKIITFNREVYVGKIHNITFSEVRFTLPRENKLMALNRTAISQILYRDGRRDVFIPLSDQSVKQKELVDTSRIIVKSQKDWMKVKVTEDPDAVTFLIPMGEISAKYEADAGNMSDEEIMRHVTVLLKKKAALVKAPFVLIETRFFRKSYGDLPGVAVTGRMFGYGGK